MSYTKNLIKEVARDKNLGLNILREAVLNAKATSSLGKRHAAKYIDPYLPGQEKHTEDTHVLEKEHEGIKKVTKLTIKGKDVINGVTHAVVIHKDSTKKIHIPISKIRKPSNKDGKHNEEHAVKRMWNTFSSSDNNRSKSLEDMHIEIESAKKDRNHPLHISKAEDHEFAGRISGNNTKVGDNVSRERAKSSYYENLRDAAHTIHAMRNHPDFKSHWKNGDTLEHSGKEKPELSEEYKKLGVKGAGATSKGDALILKSKQGVKGIKSISFKKTGGSQLMSSSPSEFHAIYHHALKETKIDTEENKNALIKAKNHLVNGEHEKANNIIQKLHNKHSELIHHVTKEALTGNGKFASATGRATHVAEIGKDAKVLTVSEFMDSHKEPISRLRPRVRASKHGGTQSTVSLETPKIPKRKIVLKKNKS